MTVFEFVSNTLLSIPAFEGRVYPTAAPEGMGKTHVVFNLLKADPETICNGDGETGLCWYTFVLHICAPDYPTVIKLARRVEDAVMYVNGSNPQLLWAEWEEPEPEGYETIWGVQRRSPRMRVLWQQSEQELLATEENYTITFGGTEIIVSP